MKIVGNPAGRGIMQAAYLAYREHGLDVAATLPAFRDYPMGNHIVRSVFWRDGLVDWCHVERTAAYRFVAELEKAAETPKPKPEGE
jgi:hypothetical protein